MPDYVTAIRTTAGDLPLDYTLGVTNKPDLSPEALGVAPVQHAENHWSTGTDPLDPNAIGAARIPVMLKITLPLTDPGWTAQIDDETGETYYTQTADVPGVDADVNTQWISVSPDPDSEDAYNAAKVTATEQGENTITFSASSIPAVDDVQCAVNAYIVIQDVNMASNTDEGVAEDAS